MANSIASTWVPTAKETAELRDAQRNAFETCAPPIGPGLSGSEMVPAFGSENCPSRMKTYSCEITEKDWQADADGRKYFINPVTHQKTYPDEIKNHRITFNPIPKP